LERHVFLAVGERRVPARFEPGWSDENRISAVQFIRFALSPDDVERFRKESDVKLAIDHARYKAETLLAPETLAALREDLATA
ncbi:MAG TPA: DUF3501 family protein, partial [Planctomycetota bacterium]|nr:DUF3501 family protein [Planctomycetota bacterium]